MSAPADPCGSIPPVEGGIEPQTLLIDRIGLLVTNDPAVGAGPLGLVRDAAVVTEGERIVWVGPADRAPAADARIDAAGRCVLPGFVDSHTHLVFAGDRAEEFAARMRGERYAAGGIRTTVAATRAASDAMLTRNASRLAAEALAAGTTTLEVKSGYGLTVRDEERSLRVAATVAEETTFLGAHVVPPEFAGRADAYAELVAGPMLDACAPHARWADVFCEEGAFDADATRHILVGGRGQGARHPGAREPVGARAGRPVGGGVGCRERRSLHVSERARFRGAQRIVYRGDIAARCRVLDALALSGREAPARRGRHRGTGQ